MVTIKGPNLPTKGLEPHPKWPKPPLKYSKTLCEHSVNLKEAIKPTKKPKAKVQKPFQKKKKKRKHEEERLLLNDFGKIHVEELEVLGTLRSECNFSGDFLLAKSKLSSFSPKQINRWKNVRKLNGLYISIGAPVQVLNGENWIGAPLQLNSYGCCGQLRLERVIARLFPPKCGYKKMIKIKIKNNKK